MRYQVPQFIEVEDKIFGPLTFKQFLYLAGSGGLAYLCIHFLPWYLGYLGAFISIGIGLAFAFYKINGKPFVFTLEAAFKYVISEKLYLWKHTEKPFKTAAEAVEAQSQVYVPKLSDSKLKDLAWSLDINEKMHASIFSEDTGQLESRNMRGKLSQ